MRRFYGTGVGNKGMTAKEEICPKIPVILTPERK
jgi:hypothetical protein